jgi:hypothetical protein
VVGDVALADATLGDVALVDMALGDMQRLVKATAMSNVVRINVFMC